MNNQNYFANKNLNNEISESHITAYLDRIKKGLFLALVFMLVSEIIMFFVVKLNIVNLSLENTLIETKWSIDFNYIKNHILIYNIINWSVFGLCLIVYNKVGFTGKKIVVSSAFLIITTIYAFGHRGFIHLSIIYAVPIIFSCPLGKKYRLSMFLSSAILTIIYSYYQNKIMETEYHILIAGVSLTIITAAYLISGCVYSSIVKAIDDIAEYSMLSNKLYDEITHDYATGAYSNSVLHRDMTENKSFQSIAFIDLDDFKKINDTMGHAMGNSILQNLVTCFQNENEYIYRYGGDEFIVLSKLNFKDLAEKLDRIKKHYNLSCRELYNCNSTFSAGVITFNKTENIEDIENILSKSDKVMYVAKHNGKNQISVGA